MLKYGRFTAFLTLLMVLLPIVTIGSQGDRVEFEKSYQQLVKHYKRRALYSDTRKYIDCDAYQKIIKGGNKNLPFVVEKLKAGDFILNNAMWDITNVDINQLAKEKGWQTNTMGGEQGVSKWWIRWWEINKNRYVKPARGK